MKKNLLKTIYKQLKESGEFDKVSKGSFDDESSAWISCYRKIDDKTTYIQELSFNYEGTIIKDINTYKEFEVVEWDQEKIC